MRNRLQIEPRSVADAAVRLGRWEFMPVVAPIPAPNATGSIVNPLAIF